MEYVRFEGLDKDVSRFFMGSMFNFISEKEKHFRNYDAAFALGVNAFDTARAYDSEETIGAWINERGIRDKIVLLTKGCHPDEGIPRVTPEDIDADLKVSLKALGTDFVDIYLLHRDDPSLPVGPIVEKLNELQAAGRIRIFGGSNWTHTRLQEANEYAYTHNLSPMSVSSPNFGLADQVKNPFAAGTVSISGNNHTEARDWYIQNQMPVLAYSPLARGLFSGRVTRALFETDPEAIDMFCRLGYCYDVNFKKLERVTELAAEKGCSIPQLAMAYLLVSKLNVFPLIGGANPEEIASTVAAVNIRLTPQEVEYLELKTDSLA